MKLYLVTNQKKVKKFLRDKTNFPMDDIPKGSRINSIELDQYINNSDIFGMTLSTSDVVKSTFGLKLEVDFDILPDTKSVKCTTFGHKAEAMLDDKGKITIKTKD